ncbi:uncharacterized protein LTR77_004539 [Saxophila tyrrhenica]|uniref:Uncharacterized protein n=1 Tax=Saxophila tyrrhenica TaxID=1690608 RepID=A0AAV9PHC7_9PEZI|nr:hypothetical protein LTR77_004539 [Saxophila tyrrhenica]
MSLTPKDDQDRAGASSSQVPQNVEAGHVEGAGDFLSASTPVPNPSRRDANAQGSRHNRVTSWLANADLSEVAQNIVQDPAATASRQSIAEPGQVILGREKIRLREEPDTVLTATMIADKVCFEGFDAPNQAVLDLFHPPGFHEDDLITALGTASIHIIAACYRILSAKPADESASRWPDEWHPFAVASSERIRNARLWMLRDLVGICLDIAAKVRAWEQKTERDVLEAEAALRQEREANPPDLISDVTDTSEGSS